MSCPAVAFLLVCKWHPVKSSFFPIYQHPKIPFDSTTLSQNINANYRVPCTLSTRIEPLCVLASPRVIYFRSKRHMLNVFGKRCSSFLIQEWVNQKCYDGRQYATTQKLMKLCFIIRKGNNVFICIYIHFVQINTIKLHLPSQPN